MTPRVTKKQKLFRRETPKAPRFAEKKSATLGDFGEVRRINIFMCRDRSGNSAATTPKNRVFRGFYECIVKATSQKLLAGHFINMEL
jgi:hypothetical protein